MDPALLDRMLAGRVKELAASQSGADPDALPRALGLFPPPGRTELRAMRAGVIERDGYRIEKWRYESRAGLIVAAHLYLPAREGPHPLILSAHGEWPGKKAAPVVQARGVAWALQGYAVLIVDSPGGEDSPGDALSDPALAMGAPWLGVYAWDLLRGLDLAHDLPEIDSGRMAITGEGTGGLAAACAFALDERLSAAALVACAASYEQGDLDWIARVGVPGLALAGDWADILARRPAPVFLVGARDDDRYLGDAIALTASKMAHPRLEIFETGHDYNRRMREAVIAFFDEHLRGAAPRAHVPEPRPITDGALNPYPAWTAPADDPELRVADPGRSITLRDLLGQVMAEPHPEPFRPEDRLVPWLKFGVVEVPHNAEIIGLHDLPASSPRIEPSIGLPFDQIDRRLAVMMGLSLPEFLAQVLHLSLPGHPETWEKHALAGEAFTAMIASVKTLFEASASETIPVKVVAEGPGASLTARFLARYRPDLTIDCSHSWTSWMNLAADDLIQPLARYLEWPFPALEV